MITIQTVMLVALGFLLAMLIALALAPAYWARAVRLTYRHINRTMPVTAEEIRADKDRLRAEYAVRIHNLETSLEKARLSAARQQVEVNRRDASISALDAELGTLRTDLEQNVNARRVLEQTVMNRLPAVEQRLADSRTLLDQRDRELASVTAETGKTVRALDEVMQINAQQRSEIERLNTVVSTRAMRNRGSLKDSQFDSEVALRSELEALRAKTRDQETLIKRLQTLVSEPSQLKGPLQVQDANGAEQPAHNRDAELERVRRDLAEAEQALRSVSEQSNGSDPALEAQINALRGTVGEQESTIRRLEAALAAYENGESASRISLKDSKIAMKARLSSLQVEVDTQATTIQKLRAELAAANERVAIQSAQFVEEMRRIGASNAPNGASVSRAAASSALRRSLADRIGEAKPALASSIKTVSRRPNGDERAAAEASSPVNDPDDGDRAVVQAGSGPPSFDAPGKGSDAGSVNGSGVNAAARTAVDVDARPRLLDRIASLAKQ